MSYRNASLLGQSDSWKASKACFLKATLIQCNISKMWCSFGLESNINSATQEGWLSTFFTSKVENEPSGWKHQPERLTGGTRLSRNQRPEDFRGSFQERWGGIWGWNQHNSLNNYANASMPAKVYGKELDRPWWTKKTPSQTSKLLDEGTT